MHATIPWLSGVFAVFTVVACSSSGGGDSESNANAKTIKAENGGLRRVRLERSRDALSEPDV